MASIGDDSGHGSLPAHPLRWPSSVESGAIIDDDSLHGEDASQGDFTRTPQDSDRFGESEDYTDVEEDDEDRENRFDGTSKTWRLFTKDERLLAASLDQQRANDLSLHLFNAHALKARVRDLEASSNADPYHRQKYWIRLDGDDSLPWHPDEAWTAWPVKPEIVLRSSEQFGVPLPDSDGRANWTYRKREAWTPSADLREGIQALLLQKVRQRFREETLKRFPPATSIQLKAQIGGKRKRRRSSYSSSESHGSISESDEAVNSPEQHSDRALRMNARILPENVEPDILSDDDVAGDVLQPNVRHMLSDLDNLLVGLHTSMQFSTHQSLPRSSRSGLHRKVSSKFRKRSGNGSEPSSDESSESELETETEMSRDEVLREVDESHESSDGEHRGPGLSTSGDNSPLDAVDNDQPLERAIPEPGRRLNPRDWSHLLGVASLNGWNPAVIDRTARRCASLFGEGMTFTEKGGSLRADGRIVKKSSRVDYFCPIETCQRNDEPYEKAWRWREHLKRSHRFSHEQIETAENGLRTGGG